MERTYHYFYALELPLNVKDELNKAAGDLRQFPFKSWVHPQDYHITLAFLGGAQIEKIETANRLIEEASNSTPVFELKIGPLGTFGREDAPRILWAGVEKSEYLEALRERVYNACLAVGFQLDTRPFNPHITMARKWIGEQSFPSSHHPFIEKDLRFSAERVVLYRTHLGKSPKYEPITLFQLAASMNE